MTEYGVRWLCCAGHTDRIGSEQRAHTLVDAAKHLGHDAEVVLLVAAESDPIPLEVATHA